MKKRVQPQFCAAMVCLLLAVSGCARNRPVEIAGPEPPCDLICQFMKLLGPEPQAPVPDVAILPAPAPAPAVVVAPPVAAPVARPHRRPRRPSHTTSALPEVTVVRRASPTPPVRVTARAALHTAIIPMPPPEPVQAAVPAEPALERLSLPGPQSIPGSVTIMPYWFEPRRPQ